MTYREMAIKVIKMACSDLMERAEELVPDTEAITNVDVVLHIPSLMDEGNCVPTIHVKTDCYASRILADEICNMLSREGY